MRCEHIAIAVFRFANVNMLDLFFASSKLRYAEFVGYVTIGMSVNIGKGIKMNFCYKSIKIYQLNNKLKLPK